jgi:DNA adenine methylase
MIYMGSKRRLAKHLLPIMLSEADKKGITTWIEPFVGGGNMIDKVPARFLRIGLDINPHVIAALRAVRDKADSLPSELSEEEYRRLKGAEPDPIKSWLRFVASFGARFDRGFARNGDTKKYRRTPVEEAKLNALKQSPLLKGVCLFCGDYTAFTQAKNALIYCDPPYESVSGYKTAYFDHTAFWEWCRKMSEDNLVFVSEYKAPDYFECVWEGSILNNFSSQRAGARRVTEKLFTLKKS